MSGDFSSSGTEFLHAGLCRPQTGGRRAHAQSRHHRWLEAQLVRGSRASHTDTESGDVARSENKSRYKVRYRDYYPETGTRVTCPMVDSGGGEVRLAT